MKRLYLLRHAKAASYSQSGEDHDRPLSDKGKTRLDLIADYVTEHAIQPQIVLTSTSLRTRETVDRLMPCLPPDIPVKELRRLYLADVDDILTEVYGLSETYDSALLVGHNPGFHELAYTLARRGQNACIEKLASKFPTAAFAALRFDVESWGSITPGQGELDHLVFPSELKD